MKRNSYLSAVLPLLLLSAGGCSRRELWHSSTLLFFDTVCDLTLACSDREFEIAQKEVERIFEEIQSSFSPGADSLDSPLALELFRKAKKIYADTEGSFDISVEPLAEIWGFRGERHCVPSDQEVAEARKNVGLDKATEEGGRIVRPETMKFDWGGIGKGFGVDLAYQALAARGIQNGFINAGGDLYCWGTNPEGVPWKIGIKHPRRRGFLGTLAITGLGAATSGDYQRFFEENGVSYHHIFDPKTGYPARGKQSVTVVGPEATVCDALSTALFVSSQPEKILIRYPEYGAVIVSRDGRVYSIGKKYHLALIS